MKASQMPSTLCSYSLRNVAEVNLVALSTTCSIASESMNTRSIESSSPKIMSSTDGRVALKQIGLGPRR